MHPLDFNCYTNCTDYAWTSHDNYYGDTASRYCKICDSLCTLCYGPNNGDCTDCINNYVLSGNTCVLGCDTNSHCDTCQFTPTVDNTVCITCPANRYYELSSFTCVTSCQTRYWEDSSTYNCTICNII